MNTEALNLSIQEIETKLRKLHPDIETTGQWSPSLPIADYVDLIKTSEATSFEDKLEISRRLRALSNELGRPIVVSLKCVAPDPQQNVGASILTNYSPGVEPLEMDRPFVPFRLKVEKNRNENQ